VLGSLLFAASPSKAAVVNRSLTAVDWIVAGGLLVGGVLAARLVQALLARALRKGDSEHQAVDVAARIVGYVLMLAAFIYALSVLGVRLGPLVGALGIGGLAIAFAAQAVLSNFLASIILQTRRPFRRGDQIRSNDHEGYVQDVNFRSVAIRTYDGERVLIPCAEVLNKPIINYSTLRRRRSRVDVGISYDADPQEVCDLLKAAVAAAPGVLERPGPDVWVTAFGDSSVNVAALFWHAPDGVYRVRSAVAVAIKRALDEAGVAIPYPVLSLASWERAATDEARR
jgi:small conductance mechanosensitive channel